MIHQKPFRGTQLNRMHPLAKGLVGCWLFNELTGETIFDSSGNGNNGTLENGVAWGDGGLEFDGVNDYVDCGDVLNFERTDSFSIVAWIKTTDGAQSHIAGKTQSSAPYKGYQLNIDGSKLEFHLVNDYVGGNRIRVIETSIGTITDGNWHQVVATYDGSSDASGVSLYIDDSNDIGGIDTNTLSATIINSNPLTMGRKIDGSYPYPYTGSIDSVRIYNRALSAEEIAWSYREPYAMFEPAFSLGTLYAALLSALKPMWYYNMLKRRNR